MVLSVDAIRAERNRALKETQAAERAIYQAQNRKLKADKQLDHWERTLIAKIKAVDERAEKEKPFIPKANSIYDRLGEAKATEWYICTRKKVYILQRAAEDATGDTEMSTYACVYCTGWHVGHTPTQGSGLTPKRAKVIFKITEKLMKGETIADS